MKAEPLFNETMSLGEGPIWDVQTNTLHWVDIIKGIMWKHDFENKQTSHRDFGQSVGMCAVAQGGGMLAALAKSIVLIRDGQEQALADNAEPTFPQNRFNDGKCDAAGRLLVGTMHRQGKPGLGALYSLEKNKGIKKLLGDVSISNGLGWSPDNRYLYYADTPSGVLWRFHYDLDTGELSDRRPLIDYTNEEGQFDGLCVDAEGCIWVAHWGGYQVSQWDPQTGKKLQSIRLPVPYVTSCCLGGSDMRTLFITTANNEDEKVRRDYPLAGAIFACQVDVPGLPANKFLI